MAATLNTHVLPTFTSATYESGHSDFLNHGNQPVVGPEERIPDTCPPMTKRKKRTIYRPPGLPLGAWTPDDTTAVPSAMPLQKPRKVRRAPSKGPAPSSRRGHGDKVSCPECSALLLPKSLHRHLERHSNWTEGKYKAHLYCRYCFAAYSRMDTLIHHQKTDLQCVLRKDLSLKFSLHTSLTTSFPVQYKIYWKERQPYLEERFCVWRAAASRV